MLKSARSQVSTSAGRAAITLNMSIRGLANMAHITFQEIHWNVKMSIFIRIFGHLDEAKRS
jgi:hypothetical protein